MICCVELFIFILNNIKRECILSGGGGRGTMNKQMHISWVLLLLDHLMRDHLSYNYEISQLIIFLYNKPVCEQYESVLIIVKMLT